MYFSYAVMGFSLMISLDSVENVQLHCKIIGTEKNDNKTLNKVLHS